MIKAPESGDYLQAYPVKTYNSTIIKAPESGDYSKAYLV